MAGLAESSAAMATHADDWTHESDLERSTDRELRGMPVAAVDTKLSAKAYLDLLRYTLVGWFGLEDEARERGVTTSRLRGLRAAGMDWPRDAETMVGLARLENVHQCVASVLHDDIPGDLIEAGVWRGGTAVFMRAVLAAYSDPKRRVWVADSFAGFPPRDPDRYPDESPTDFGQFPELVVDLETVRANFAKYSLLDERVRFLVGWFEETLPLAETGPLSVVRLDCDYYASTLVALEALYPRLSAGGYLIVDDYFCIESCRRAVDDFRVANGIDCAIQQVDVSAGYWRRASAAP